MDGFIGVLPREGYVARLSHWVLSVKKQVMTLRILTYNFRDIVMGDR